MARAANTKSSDGETPVKRKVGRPRKHAIPGEPLPDAPNEQEGYRWPEEPEEDEPTDAGGRPLEMIRWTLARAASEFRIDKSTLSKRVKAYNMIPAEDGKWSTRQIAEAVFGSLEREKVRKLMLEADHQEMVNDEKSGKLISLDAVRQSDAQVATILKQKILGSTLEPDEQDDLLKEIHDALMKEATKPLKKARK